MLVKAVLVEAVLVEAVLVEAVLVESRFSRSIVVQQRNSTFTMTALNVNERRSLL